MVDLLAFAEIEREALDEIRNGGGSASGGGAAALRGTGIAAIPGVRETRVGNTLERSGEGQAAFDLLASIAEPEPEPEAAPPLSS